MPLVRYITADGNEYEAEVPVGNTIMQGAVDNMIDGILGECGGAGACATCHCFVDADWNDKTGGAGDSEQEMLEAIPGADERSRLSCQIEITAELDGVVVHLPAAQF
ncbi:2Fe-2S iron-sulfur cluster-binding protein [Aestuariirhabdus sp. LZHN29]|uniref:2Fe-2S iron-sulfur cluster-binding protein n=1 Tax=Aestuariirhabdus sp. LZHN29 TaxID=3417462 RepID=UPI003CE73AC9